MSGVGSASVAEVLPRECLQKNWSHFQLWVNQGGLEGFDPLPFYFSMPQFALSGEVHLLVASEYSSAVAGCSVCRTMGTGRMRLICTYTRFNTSTASLHVMDDAYTHISAKIFVDVSTGILSALPSITWWGQGCMVSYSPPSLNQVATTATVMKSCSSMCWLH